MAVLDTLSRAAHMQHLVDQFAALQAKLRLGGGEAKIAKQHQAGRMTCEERIAGLSDSFLEIGLLIAFLTAMTELHRGRES